VSDRFEHVNNFVVDHDLVLFEVFLFLLFEMLLFILIVTEYLQVKEKVLG